MQLLKKYLSSPIVIIATILSSLLLIFYFLFPHLSVPIQLIICFGFGLFLFVCRKQWLAEDISNKLQFFLLTLGIGLTFSYSGWHPLIKAFIQELPPAFKPFKEISSPFLLVFALLIISLISFLLKRNTILKEHPSSISKEFPEKGFKTKLKNFIKVLNNDLNNIDIETNWNEYYFIPLEADVEINSNNRKRKKVTNLLNSIKKDKKSQVLLVLGNPGSGKSTALRKLARKLLQEAEITGRIPIYINLKDWQDDKEYSEAALVTANDIYAFIIKRLKGKDIFADKFIDAYFDKMYENGRIFFILDSFDEIPRVLDANENSWIIDNLSDAFYNFLAGASESRGVLSSRNFRKPTKKFKSKTTLEIRPFNELSIKEVFTRSLNNISKEFFKKFSNSGLLPIARNPFSAALIAQFLDENEMQLPANQSEIYKSYINKRFSNCSEKMEEIGISVNELISFCTELSYLIFSSQRNGLEITTNELRIKMKHPLVEKIDAIIALILFAKIGRLSPTDNKFSFVHRRFNEYFVALKFMEQPSMISPDIIPTDSRWRDALVLFCEIADESFARYIALFCWKEIKEMKEQEDSSTSNDQFLRSIHCLRFLADAFRNRRAVIADFEDELAAILLHNIQKKGESILTKKLYVEAVGILKPAQMDDCILAALETKSPWVSEEAFKASRFLQQISGNLEKSIMKYILAFSPRQMLQSRKEMLFASQLSEPFRKVSTIVRLKIIDSCLYYIGISIFVWLIPMPSLMVIFATYFLSNSNKKPLIRRISFFLLFLEILYIQATPCSCSTGASPNSVHFMAIAFKPIIMIYTNSFLKIDHMIMQLTAPLARNYPSIFNSIVLLAVFATFPFLDFIFWVLHGKKTFRKYVHLLLKLFLYILLTIAAIWTSFYLSQLMRFPILMGLTPLLVLAGNVAGTSFMKYFHDRRELRKVLKPLNKTFSREQITYTLTKLKTRKAKFTFLNYLANNSIIPIGQWPGNKMPNWNDPVSEHLARQEERWLNLDK